MNQYVICPFCGKILVIGTTVHFWHCGRQQNVIPNITEIVDERLVDGTGYPSWSVWAKEYEEVKNNE